jgi:2-polyprenyl-3-methyl-5-hydroxy-6-metoxy-1,4-benzoquinol methylase
MASSWFHPQREDEVDRSQWLAARRRAVEQDYTRDAPTYDEGYDPRTPTHRRFVATLIEACPEGGTILDAACGTGPYMDMVLQAGCRVIGIDQSVGMLERARVKHPDARLERIGLQELAMEAECDAAMCVDAMEHVPPEEWPQVLANLRRAVRPGSHLYLTVEQVESAELDRATTTAHDAPMVHGEDVGGDTGGYHFYPSREQVAGWLEDAGFAIVDEADEWLDGYGYHHLLLRSPSL